MFKYSIFLLLLLLQLSTRSTAQNVNWKRTGAENKHLVYANVGLNFGAVAALGYAYRLPIAHAILLNAEFSSPFGKNVFDDFKSKLGAQTQVWQAGGFSVAVQLAGVFRQYESDFVRLENFGSETGATFGFYRRKWFVAAECSFDKAITTHVKHSDVMLENNPGLRNGWYVPTGGNFLYGLQTGISFGKNDLHLAAGKSVTQDFKTTPLFPVYLQLGYNRRF